MSCDYRFPSLLAIAHFDLPLGGIGLEVRGQVLVGDDEVDLLQPLKEDVGIALELGVVHDQYLLLGIVQHLLAHVCLADVVVGKAELHVHLRAADKSAVGIVAAQRLHRVRIGKGQGAPAEGAADTDEVYAGIGPAEKIADSKGVCHQRDVQLPGQDRLGNGEAGRTGVKHDHIVFPDLADGGLGQLLLGMLEVGLAQLHGIALVIFFYKIRAAVGAHQLPGLLHLLEIAAHRLLAALEHFAHVRNKDKARLADLLVDQVMAFYF